MATIKMTMLAETSGLRNGIKGVNNELNGMGKNTSRVGGLLKKALIGGGALVGISALTSKFKEAGAAVLEQNKLAAQTSSVLKSTGNAAGVTAQGVKSLSDSIEKKSMLDAEAIHSGQNLLLTFTNIKNAAGAGNDIFNQTTKTMADMATAMGTDPKNAAMQLGKALNDPIKGVGALSRVGVAFTAQQKEQIKTLVESGDTMGAQKIILKELGKEFGGSAAAAGKTAAGQFKHLKDTIDDVFESIVRKALPYLVRLATYLQKNIPAALQAIQPALNAAKTLFTTFGPPVLAVVKFLGQHVKALIAVGVAVGALMAIQKAHAAFLAVQAAGGLLKYLASMNIVKGATAAYTAVQWAMNAAMSANPIGLVIIAVVALIAAIVLLWKNSETFRNIVTGAWNGIKAASVAVFGFLKKFISAVWNGIKSVVTGVVKVMGTIIRTYFNAYKTVIVAVWKAVKTATQAVWNGIKNAVTNAVGAVMTVIRSIKGKVTGAFRGAAGWLKSAGKNILQGLINGVTSLAGTLKDKAMQIAHDAIDAVKNVFRIGSPSRVFHEIGVYVGKGLINGLGSNSGAVALAGGAMARNVESGFNAPRLSLNASGSNGGAGMTVNVQVVATPGTDKAALGRELQEMLDAYQRQGGKTRAF